MLTGRNGKTYVILFQHPDGDYYVRLQNAQQTRWIKSTDRYYRRTTE